MKKTYNIRRHLFILLLILSNTTLTAQRLFDNSEDANIFRQYKPWGINLSFNNYPFFRHTPPATGTLTPRWYLMWGFSAGLTYHVRLTNHFGLKFNLKAEKSPVYSYRLYLPGSETTDGEDFYDNIGNRYAPFMVRLPAGVEFRTFFAHPYVFLFQAGIDAGYHFGFSETSLHNAYFSTAFAVNSAFVFDPYIKLGWYYEFPRALWQTALVYRHALNDYYSGVYAMDNFKNAPPTGGTITQSGSYIGLEFVVYFKRPYYDNARCAGQVHSKKVLKKRRAEEKAREKARKAEEKMKKKEIKRNKKLKRKKKRFIIF